MKRECPTCELVVPVLEALRDRDGMNVIVQDDPTFPEGLAPRHDADLALSWHHAIEAVPTLLRVVDGREKERAVGWQRDEWGGAHRREGARRRAAGLAPRCGSLSVDPDLLPALRALFEGERLASRRIELTDGEDEAEAMLARGWSDGLPLVPPTPERVLAMLAGTGRAPDEVVAVVPPDLVPCTVEKAAINAVMAGCKPEYLPVVLAALEAACTDQFNIHGVLATTMGVGPVVVVNGPIRRAIGMNSGINALGQGNRANSTIGRALQLVIRNVGGGRPGEVDRATYGNPGKVGFCFAEDEEGSPWEPLSVSLGAKPGANTVTLFTGEGPRTIVDQLSRDPESLARSLASCLRTVFHPKLVLGFDAMLVIGPEHARVFQEGRVGSGAAPRSPLRASADPRRRDRTRCRRHGRGRARTGRGPRATLSEVPAGGLLIVHAGGPAGLFSAVIGGWVSGGTGSQPVLREVGS